MPAKDLFPETEPYDTGFLTLSAPHRMYYEQCGNPKGVPVAQALRAPRAAVSRASWRHVGVVPILAMAIRSLISPSTLFRATSLSSRRFPHQGPGRHETLKRP